jgi:cytochrome oxidase Cu insertion factor (SCO1/SenC/PrrC family)
MDPARDTQRAAVIVDKRQLGRRRWTLASPPASRRARGGRRCSGIRYRQLADGDFNHTTALVLLDADGRILATHRTGGKPARSGPSSPAGAQGDERRNAQMDDTYRLPTGESHQ